MKIQYNGGEQREFSEYRLVVDPRQVVEVDDATAEQLLVSPEWAKVKETKQADKTAEGSEKKE